MKTNAQRQRDWRTRHTTGFGRMKKQPLNMHRIMTHLMQHGDTKAGDLYRAFNAQREKDVWRWLADAIQENALLGDGKLAPVTRIGLGTCVSPFYYCLSEKWDITRDWDAEQTAL